MKRDLLCAFMLIMALQAAGQSEQTADVRMTGIPRQSYFPSMGKPQYLHSHNFGYSRHLYDPSLPAVSFYPLSDRLFDPSDIYAGGASVRRVSFIGSGRHIVLPGFGSKRSVSAGVRWVPVGGVALKTRIFADKLYTPVATRAGNYAGGNLTLTYDINDLLRLEIWGQYVVSDTRLPYGYMDNLLPKTGFGGSATVRVGTKARIGFTSQYQFDEVMEKWDHSSQGQLQFSF